MNEQASPAPATAATDEADPQASMRRRLIGDVEVALEAFVGGATITVARLTALKPGEAVPLDAALNQAVELRLNGVAVARGELVAVEDRFGVRLTEVTS